MWICIIGWSPGRNSCQRMPLKPKCNRSERNVSQCCSRFLLVLRRRVLKRKCWHLIHCLVISSTNKSRVFAKENHARGGPTRKLERSRALCLLARRGRNRVASRRSDQTARFALDQILRSHDLCFDSNDACHQTTQYFFHLQSSPAVELDRILRRGEPLSEGHVAIFYALKRCDLYVE